VNSRQLYSSLLSSSQFKEWKKKHGETYLSHFFCSLRRDFTPKSNWEIGFFNKMNAKITVFVNVEKGFIEKPEDEVFSKEAPHIDKLEVSTMKFDFDGALMIYKDKAPVFFSNQPLGDGFVILQNKNGMPLWTFTFVSQTLQFCTMAINAKTGEIVSHDIVNVVQK